MYALVDIKGKQYKAEKGSLLRIDKINNAKGDVVEFDSVLLTSDKDDIKVGTPYVKGVKVKAVVEDQIKDKKVIVFKYKRRKGYRRKQGHRQQYTIIRVQEIA
jgi:large subunit ribosomal protein L21